jgi:hypothetical protein
MPNGAVEFAHISKVVYTGLPNDGVHAIDSKGMPIPNVATNLAGASASVVPVPPPAARPDLNQHGLTGSWYEAATSGQGVEIEIYPDLTAPGTGLAFMSWFTYDSAVGGAERQRWSTRTPAATSMCRRLPRPKPSVPRRSASTRAPVACCRTASPTVRAGPAAYR